MDPHRRSYWGVYEKAHILGQFNTLPEIQTKLARLRALRRRAPVFSYRWFWLAAAIAGLREVRTKKYKSDRRAVLTYDEWCDDIPPWCIPGLGRLTEPVDRTLWHAGWTHLGPEGPIPCAAIRDHGNNTGYTWHTWKLDHGRMEYQGAFDSFYHAYQATAPLDTLEF